MNKYKQLVSAIIICGIGLTFFSCSSAFKISKVVNDPVVLSANGSNQINLITYNIKDVFGSADEKLNGLLEYVNNENFDFVVLQELFNEGTRDYIVSRIDTAKFRSIIARIDYSSFPELLFQDAGLFMMSRYPVIDLSEIDFGDEIVNSGNVIHRLLEKQLSLSTDFLANKSVAGSLFEINDSTKLLLCNTHVQALGTKYHKRAQLKQIKRFIDRAVYELLKSNMVDSPENLIVMLTGDFNSDAYNEEKFELMQTYLGNPRDLHSEFKPGEKEFTFRLRLFNNLWRFDYIFAYDRVGPVDLKKVKVVSINATDVRSDDDESLSDHLALKASFEIE